MIALELPFPIVGTEDLDALVDEIDRAVDACFLSDVTEALGRARRAPDADAEASAA